MKDFKGYCLLNPETGAPALKIIPFDGPATLPQSNIFRFHIIMLIESGGGIIEMDLNAYKFSGPSLISISAYQPFRISPSDTIAGYYIQLPADFFWNHKVVVEMSCKGALFANNLCNPVMQLENSEMRDLLLPLLSVIRETQHDHIGRYEMTISLINIFMISAARIKVGRQGHVLPAPGTESTPAGYLMEAIEKNYFRLHRPVEYASMLNTTVKQLNKVAKQYTGKTISCLIITRIMTEAKRRLHLSEKSVKEIAYEIGFRDEAYFSRVFKSQERMTAQAFRWSVRNQKTSAAA